MPSADAAKLEMIESEIAHLRARLVHYRNTIRSLWSEENESYRLVEAKRRYACYVVTRMERLTSRLQRREAEELDLRLTIAGKELRMHMR